MTSSLSYWERGTSKWSQISQNARNLANTRSMSQSERKERPHSRQSTSQCISVQHPRALKSNEKSWYILFLRWLLNLEELLGFFWDFLSWQYGTTSSWWDVVQKLSRCVKMLTRKEIRFNLRVQNERDVRSGGHGIEVRPGENVVDQVMENKLFLCNLQYKQYIQWMW